MVHPRKASKLQLLGIQNLQAAIVNFPNPNPHAAVPNASLGCPAWACAALTHKGKPCAAHASPRVRMGAPVLGFGSGCLLFFKSSSLRRWNVLQLYIKQLNTAVLFLFTAVYYIKKILHYFTNKKKYCT